MGTVGIAMDRRDAVVGQRRLEDPSDFRPGREQLRFALRIPRSGVEHPVIPGAPWMFDHVISPHLWAFGWVTIFSEATLAILLMSGRYRRLAAGLGIIQSFAILAPVANAPGEWYWSYILMIALHVAVLTTTPGAREQSARTMAIVTVGFGAVLALAHAGAGFTGTGFTLFNGTTSLPDDAGRNLFGGSIALGLIVAAIGAAGILCATRLAESQQRVAGIALVVLGVILILTYRSDGLILKLGSTTTTACVIVALGVSLAMPSRQADSAPPAAPEAH